MTITDITTEITVGSIVDGTAAAAVAAEAGIAIDLGTVQAFAERVGYDISRAANAVLVYLGDRLGLWRTIASVESVTSESLAERTGFDAAVPDGVAGRAGRCGVPGLRPCGQELSADTGEGAGARRRRQPGRARGRLRVPGRGMGQRGPARARLRQRRGHRLGRSGSADGDVNGAVVQAAVRRLADAAVDARRSPGLVDRLQAGGRVLDIGCGLGTASRMLAEAFPALSVVGFDDHDDSIRQATVAARRTGLDDRVTFRVAGVLDEPTDGPFDAVFMFDTLHDLGDPVGALRTAREVLAEDGYLVIIEPAAADALEDNLHAIGVRWYASSTIACVPGSLSQDVGAALGAQAGPARLLETISAAGFADAKVFATTPFNQVIAARR